MRNRWTVGVWGMGMGYEYGGWARREKRVHDRSHVMFEFDIIMLYYYTLTTAYVSLMSQALLANEDAADQPADCNTSH